MTQNSSPSSHSLDVHVSGRKKTFKMSNQANPYLKII
jgi:hypothetical protein